ncbi:MAG: dockerin type I domain-containing protein [Candidatus Omnitrophica bacterium]|nr:dockerin type I domain-containing protein [Candidatus Omnitrophota bacterium]
MMKTMKMKKIIIISAVMIAISFMGGGLLFANGADDNTDRLTSNQSHTFSPGYINAAKQQTDAILRQESSEKSLFDRAVEYVQSKLGNKIEEATIPVKGPLGGSGGGETTQTQLKAEAPGIIGPGDTNGDGVVDAVDYINVKMSFGSKKGDSGYIAGADFNKNGQVDYDDYISLLSNFGTRYVTTPKSTKVLVTVTDPYRGRDMRRDKDRPPSDYYKTSYEDSSNTGKSRDTEKTKSEALSGDAFTASTQPPGDASEKYALSAPLTPVTYKGTELKDGTDQSPALSAAKDLTEDQKVLMDTISNFLKDMNDIEKVVGENPELKKASDNLIQMVANILLAQAIPDLLKEGDLANIKGTFDDLNSSKARIISGYMESTKPYYEEVKKLLEKNANALNLSLGGILEKELREAPRSEIEKVLAKIRSKEKRSFEEDYILQQEAKIKAKYIDPSKKKLEEDMKVILQDATKKLNATLENISDKKKQ